MWTIWMWGAADNVDVVGKEEVDAKYEEETVEEQGLSPGW
jgi:hypothetical protein